MTYPHRIGVDLPSVATAGMSPLRQIGVLAGLLASVVLSADPSRAAAQQIVKTETAPTPVMDTLTLPLGVPEATTVIEPFPSGSQAPSRPDTPVVAPSPLPVDADWTSPRHGSGARNIPGGGPRLLEQQASEKELRYLRLEEQVRRLDELSRLHHAPIAPDSNVAVTTPVVDDGSSPVPDTNEAGESDLPSTAEKAATPPTNAASDPTSPSTAAQPPVVEQLVTLTPVVAGEVDRLGLADSLYAAGDVSRAREVYQLLPTETLRTEQRQWVEYQLASCLRRQGEVDEAERRYRQLLTAHPTGWLSDLCRWWLQHLDDQRRLTSNSARLRELLDGLASELSAAAKSPP